MCLSYFLKCLLKLSRIDFEPLNVVRYVLNFNRGFIKMCVWCEELILKIIFIFYVIGFILKN